MKLKLSRADIVRQSALDKIDRHFAARLSAEFSGIGFVHLLKRLEVATGRQGILTQGEHKEISSKAEEQDARIAELEFERRRLKSCIRAASSAKEIDEILSALDPQPTPLNQW